MLGCNGNDGLHQFLKLFYGDGLAIDFGDGSIAFLDDSCDGNLGFVFSCPFFEQGGHS